MTTLQYALAMILVFILQISAAIAAFTLISKSRNMVSDQLQTMMGNYGYDDPLKIDWIQSKVCYDFEIIDFKSESIISK